MIVESMGLVEAIERVLGRHLELCGDRPFAVEGV